MTAQTILPKQGGQESADVAALASGAGITFVGRAVGSGAQALSQVFLARLLGPEVFGLYAIGWTILRMGEIVATLGLDNGVIRFASHFWPAGDAALRGVLFRSLGWAFSSGVVMGVAVFATAPWLAGRIFQKPALTPVLQLFALGFPLMTSLKVAAAATRVSQRMRFSVLAEDVSRPVTNLVLILIAYVLGVGLLGAVAAGLLAFGLALILALGYVRHLYARALSARAASPVKSRELLAFSLSAALAGIFSMFITWIDRLFVGAYRAAGDVGVYQAVAQFSIIFTLTLSAVNAIFAPMIASLYHKGETERLEALFRISTKWMMYLSLPVFLVICFAPGQALSVLFGSQYVDGALPLVIVAAAQLVNVGTGSVGYLLTMTSHQKEWMTIAGTMLLTSLVLNWLLVPRWGLVGAACATAISISGLFLMGLVRVKRCLGLWPYDRRYLKGLIATIATLGVLVIIRLPETALPIIHIIVTSALSVGTFAVTLWLLGLDSEDWEFIRLIRARLRV